jgi:hypothetical protein
MTDQPGTAEADRRATAQPQPPAGPTAAAVPTAPSPPDRSGTPRPTGGSARRRRPFDLVLHAPQTLRALVRTNEIWLVALAAVVGLAAGLLVVAMNIGTLANSARSTARNSQVTPWDQGRPSR